MEEPIELKCSGKIPLGSHISLGKKIGTGQPFARNPQYTFKSSLADIHLDHISDNTFIFLIKQFYSNFNGKECMCVTMEGKVWVRIPVSTKLSYCFHCYFL